VKLTRLIRLLRSRAVVWLAACAVLLGTFAPLVSVLRISDAYGVAQDYCLGVGENHAGGEWTVLVAGPASTHTGHGLDHGAACAYCVFYAGQYALAPPLGGPPRSLDTMPVWRAWTPLQHFTQSGFAAFLARAPPFAQSTLMQV
jgi:hypothetical protein